MHVSLVALSKVGKQLLRLPVGVTITRQPLTKTLLTNVPLGVKSAVVVSGALGTLAMPVAPCVSLELPLLEKKDSSDEKKGVEKVAKRFVRVSVKDPKDKRHKSMWGTTRRLIENMVTGVSEGFVIPIKLVGVGYRAALEDQKVFLKLGHSHPITVNVPQGVDVNVPAPQRLILRGIDLQVVSQFAANIRKHRPPEPYNQKGVFVGDETIKKKEGKKR
ncbi:ribosomal protein L6, alpha-beta domain-containing protein [Chytriomyces cf. hyalinus JEL632]|nr:ribosomal protein L6, alpha-beta domain-containing protein [Chytriomyces cf. hyalinus JEL632]